MTRIKICGLFRQDDIESVNQALPDYIGFVFAKSKRRISIEKAFELKKRLDKRIKVVGVFVNENPEIIKNICEKGIIDIVQLHGEEDDLYIEQIRGKTGCKIIKSFSMDDSPTKKQLEDSKADWILLDSGKGGTGESFQWGKIPRISRKFFLAGGLSYSNMEMALKNIAPFAVDLSSGVETDGLKDRKKIETIVRSVHMTKGRFGIHGGQYMPEILMNEVIKLEEAYEYYKNNEEFVSELDSLLKNYAGRPSLLYFAKNMTEDLGGAKIYLKREDLNHTGSHKINNVLGQALMANKMGKRRLIAETGAGQHGVATATAAALLGLDCEIFMGKEDTDRQSLNVYRMRLLGAKVHSVTSGTMTLKDAVNEAMKEWTTRMDDTFYVLGSVVGAHPYPTIVRDFQQVISKEAREQILEYEGKLPAAVVACVGGGSNAMGMFYNFIGDENVELIGVEAAGLGLDTEKHAATINKGRYGIFHGMKSYFCQDEEGQITPVYSISAGLDYPGIGPEHSQLYDTKRAEYAAITDDEAVEAFEYIAKTEGIIAAIESSHAVAHVMKIAKNYSKEDSIIICLSGRGDKDVAAIARYRGVDIDE